MRQAIVTALCLLATPVWAEGEPAADFDYYVLSLSWSPTWCALEGAARNSPQCDRALGWVLHGLWPQYERGWPSYCNSAASDPSRRDTAAMADIMGTSGAAWHQWNKHGRCTGLSSAAFFETSRDAFARIAQPPALNTLPRDIRLPATVVEDAFVAANPGLSHDAVTVTCRSSRIHEVRICLTRDLEPRKCSADVSRDCTLQDALFADID